MKRFMFVALMAMFMASCATDEIKEIQRDDIGFRASAKNTTRADVVTTASLASFNVWAFYEGAAMMENVEVTKQADNSWGYDVKKYWPATGTVDFFALSSSTASHSHTVTNSITATAPAFTFAATASSDKIVASTIPDILYATAVDKTRTTEDVLMNFRHAMSQIAFAVKNNSTQDLSITFGESVTIQNIKANGTYSLPTTNSTTDDFEVAASHGSWALSGSAIDHTVAVAGGTFASGSSATAENFTVGTNLVLPQSAAAKIIVPAVIKQGNIVVFDDDIEVSVDTAWEEGKNYTYTFTLADGTDLLYEITFDATVDEFKEGGDTAIHVPDNQ